MRSPWIYRLALVGLLCGPAWATQTRTHRVTMKQLPEAVRSTVEQESAGGSVQHIAKVSEGGKPVYRVQIMKNGAPTYVHVGEDGHVVQRETGAQESQMKGTAAHPQ